MALCEGCEVTVCSLWQKVGVTEEAVIAFLQNHGVLLKEKICHKCENKCSLSLTEMMFRCEYTVDGVTKKCDLRVPLKSNTWLNQTNLSVTKVGQFVCLWLLTPDPRNDLIKSELDMAEETVLQWSNYCQEVCFNSLILDDEEVLGGPGTIVEIDEAKLGEMKNSRDRIIKGSWIFGCLQRDNNRGIFVPVQNRSASTLIEVIKRRIAAGTTIVTDRWKGYDPLIDHPQYEDLTENHLMNFIDPMKGNQRPSNKKFWREVCSNVPRFGKDKNKLDGFLAEFYWKSKFEWKSRVHQFFREVARQFDPNK